MNFLVKLKEFTFGQNGLTQDDVYRFITHIQQGQNENYADLVATRDFLFNDMLSTHKIFIMPTEREKFTLVLGLGGPIIISLALGLGPVGISLLLSSAVVVELFAYSLNQYKLLGSILNALDNKILSLERQMHGLFDNSDAREKSHKANAMLDRIYAREHIVEFKLH